jgi:DNA end-binding protein Ku
MQQPSLPPADSTPVHQFAMIVLVERNSELRQAGIERGLAMAPRAYWKGYLKLSLVSCPIALYPASSTSERVSFNRINSKTGNRLKQQMVDAESGEAVDKEDVKRGYEYGKGQYLIVEDADLDRIKIESTHTIEINSFVARGEIDDRFLVSPYYISPTDRVGQEAFAVIRDAMREKQMVGLAPLVLTRREHVVMLEPFDKGMLATTLRYPYEIRDPAEYFEGIPDLDLPAEMKKLAVHIVETKVASFDPKSFEDRYEKALVELLQAKQSGEPIQAVGEQVAPRVINLMDALRASIDASAKKPAAASTGERRRVKKKAGAR